MGLVSICHCALEPLHSFCPLSTPFSLGHHQSVLCISWVLFCFFIGSYCEACRILVSQPGIKPGPSAVGAQSALDYQGIPCFGFYIAWISDIIGYLSLFPLAYPQLLLSRFIRVQLCATPWMAAHQALPSLGFSRQEHWSGLQFPPPVHESEKWKWSHSVVSYS